MKEKIKSFLLGVMVTSLVAASIPAIAEKMNKSAELLYNNIKVVIDGKQADLKDANGNTVEPFIIEGTTYLPVRGVATAINKAVSWDGATQTVYLGKNEEIEQPSVWLKDLETFSGEVIGCSADELEFGGHEYNNILTDNTGKVYINYWYPANENVSYLLNYKYSRFKGTFYLSNGDKNYNAEQRMVVYGDNKVIYTSESIAMGEKPITFDIDVSNISVIKIVYQELNTSGWKDLRYANHYFGYSDYDKTMATPIGNAGLYE